MDKIDFFIAPTDDVWARDSNQSLFMTIIKFENIRPGI